MTSFSLGGDSGNSFPFDHIGASVTGTVQGMEEVQQTDFKDGKPKFWDDGKPMVMYRVTLATDLRKPEDPSDDGTRAVYLRGSRKPETQSTMAAVLGAVKQVTGKSDLQAGGRLTLTFVGEDKSGGGGMPRKLYTAEYETPRLTLDQMQSEMDAAAGSAPASPAVALPATATPSADPAVMAALANLNPEALAALVAQQQAAVS